MNAQVCPLCLGTASSEALNERDDSEDPVVQNRYLLSSKISALMQNLRRYRQTSGDKPIKRYPVTASLLIFIY